ncbi:hypothetical protein VNO78_32851 [Psophocarpus tetragonolobus]|uniref:Cytochrome P450 n=1 Tax=Psophocarpus tetragonolobus TaxID=3891 RepID=A0AAN9RS54_PSOTE
MEKSEAPGFDEVKDMVYMHAALCKSMGLYLSMSMDNKEVEDDDILANGTVVKKREIGDVSRVRDGKVGESRSQDMFGKEMAFMQMQRVVVGIMRQFMVVLVVLREVDLHFISFLSSQMKGGFPVKITHKKTSI